MLIVTYERQRSQQANSRIWLVACACGWPGVTWVGPFRKQAQALAAWAEHAPEAPQDCPHCHGEAWFDTPSPGSR